MTSENPSAPNGKLILIPVPLGEKSSYVYSAGDAMLIRSVKRVLVENLKPAKRTLYYFYKERFPGEIADFEALEWYQMNDLSPMEKIQLFRQPAVTGLMSDAGCPAVADPGAEYVRLAHASEYEVLPLIGPSSVLLALTASGLAGQHFSFNGYLPAKPDERAKKIKEYERTSRDQHRTQIFIETPYRNKALFEDLVKRLAPDTLLSVAADLTLESQFIKTRTVADWKKIPPPDLHKRPTIFSFLGFTSGR